MTDTLPTYEQHPLAIALMPGGMDDSEFKAFCDDVEARGIIYPITIFEGKVLDGWHRYRAGHKTGTAFKTITYTGKDPAGYIAACNVLRRKLSSLQRALVGARMHLDHGFTQREVCAKLAISNEVVNLVLKALKSKAAKLIKRIENDADFTRSQLREELEDAGVQKPASAKGTPNSVFALGGDGATDEDDDGGDTDGINDGPIGAGAEPLPDTGKKASHKERRAKATAAQALQEAFKALMFDEKVSFIQMIWPEARPIAVELGLVAQKDAGKTVEELLDRRATTPSGAGPADPVDAMLDRRGSGKKAPWDQPQKPAKGSKKSKA